MAVSIQNVLFTSNDANSHKSQWEQAGQSFRIHSVLKFKVGGEGERKLKTKRQTKNERTKKKPSHKHSSFIRSLMWSQTSL